MKKSYWGVLMLGTMLLLSACNSNDNNKMDEKPSTEMKNDGMMEEKKMDGDEMKNDGMMEEKKVDGDEMKNDGMMEEDNKM
jgi:major membrane immunogen (membrane-anchored lipoprotein)